MTNPGLNASRFPIAPLLLLLLAAASRGEEIIELNPLTIGTIAISNNLTTGRIDIGRDGSYSDSGPLIMLAPGAPGRYRLQGFTPSSLITLSLSATPIRPLSGSGASLEVLSFDYPPLLISDSSGVLHLDLGISIATTGSGSRYTDGPHAGTITLYAVIP